MLEIFIYENKKGVASRLGTYQCYVPPNPRDYIRHCNKLYVVEGRIFNPDENSVEVLVKYVKDSRKPQR